MEKCKDVLTRNKELIVIENCLKCRGTHIRAKTVHGFALTFYETKFSFKKNKTNPFDYVEDFDIIDKNGIKIGHFIVLV